MDAFRLDMPAWAMAQIMCTLPQEQPKWNAPIKLLSWTCDFTALRLKVYSNILYETPGEATQNEIQLNKE